MTHEVQEIVFNSTVNSMLNSIQETRDFYSLISRLKKVNGSNVQKPLIDRVMFNAENLPPMGKEYWWYLGFDKTGDSPRQIMLMIFRKYGDKMLFNNQEMSLETYGKNRFKAITVGWIYDGEKVHDLGPTNAMVNVDPHRIVTEIEGEKMVISGGYPDFRIQLGDTVDLKVTKSVSPQEKLAQGFLMHPLGVGWVDTFGSVEGSVKGRSFSGESHLQKVVGINPFGPFHWTRLLFQDGSVVTMFTLKTGKSSGNLFRKSLKFYDNQNNEEIFFNNPQLKISKREDDGVTWVIEGKDSNKSCLIELESHAEIRQEMKGGGTQTYIEYAVMPSKFNLKTPDREVTLSDLGKGWGTFEDAYW